MGLSLHQNTHHSHGKLEHKGNAKRENLNVRAAFIHVIGDFLQSFGVLLAALVIYFKVTINSFSGLLK